MYKYKSPIKIMVDDNITIQMHQLEHRLEEQQEQQEDQMVFEAVRNCNIIVDEEELIKALEYDRNQYSKGYKDGVNHILDGITLDIGLMFNDPTVPRHSVDKFLKIIDRYKESEEE